jgi:Asp-tRNA(Asn)/Glu-tRNA(Gln) amidotransferase A subunit family amidase
MTRVVAGAVVAAALSAALGRGVGPILPAGFDVTEKSIAELQEAMSSGAVTSRDLVAAYQARIEAYDRLGPKLNAMIFLNPRALDAADALDKERAAKGPRGPLHGIPIVVKDNFDTADMPTTGGSIALAGFEPKEDAFQIKKLRDAGVVIVGKTNLHELAAGITSVSSFLI